MKQTISVFITTLLCVSSAALAETFKAKGALSCTIKHQQVTQVKEGKPELFSGFKGNAKVGDTLEFYYTFTNDWLGTKVTFELDDLERENEDWLSARYSNGNGAQIVYSEKTKPRVSLKTNYQEVEFDIGVGGIFSFSSDYIFVENIVSTLKLWRYYKGDYSGLFLQAFDDYIWVATLDCRTRIDAVDDVYKLVKSSKDVQIEE